MSVAENPIEQATSLNTAIEIISREEVQLGREVLKWQFQRMFYGEAPVCLIPIMQAGVRVAKDFARVSGLTMNPMRMNYYASDGERMSAPQCKGGPDIHKIVDIHTGRTKDIALTEAVVDSQATVLAAMSAIHKQVDDLSKAEGKRFRQPNIFVFALLSKTNMDGLIPNFYYAFDFHPDVWAAGFGCDANGKARNIDNIVGYKSPYATGIITQPLFTRSELTRKFLAPRN